MYSKLIMKAVLFAGVYATAMPCYCEISHISAEELGALLAGKSSNVTVVDVRGGYDFQKGHIPGAVNAPYNVVEKANLPKDGALVLYCGNEKCPLSNLAVATLEAGGYKDVKTLDGGIAAWLAKGFAVETAAGMEKKKEPIAVASMPPAQVLKRLTDNAMGLIDTRPEAEFIIAHIQGAKSIPQESLAAACADLSKDTEWVVYDRQAGRATAAAQLLAEKGFKVKELSGGMQVWAAKKYPMESGKVK